jgi:hypothetical protein
MLPKKLPRSRAAVRRPGKNARKAPLCRAFLCAEEDSNLHPVSLDQALNLVTLVSYPSGSRQIVRIVPAHGRYGRIGRSGCCHGCCHDRPRRLCGGPAAPMPRRRPAMASSSAGARRCPRPTVVRVPEDRAPWPSASTRRSGDEHLRAGRTAARGHRGGGRVAPRAMRRLRWSRGARVWTPGRHAGVHPAARPWRSRTIERFNDAFDKRFIRHKRFTDRNPAC